GLPLGLGNVPLAGLGMAARYPRRLSRSAQLRQSGGGRPSALQRRDARHSFFDDMDIALRDRETVQETEDQAVFLSALDGLKVHEGVVFVFTTNCALELIDPAFKRPGR